MQVTPAAMHQQQQAQLRAGAHPVHVALQDLLAQLLVRLLDLGRVYKDWLVREQLQHKAAHTPQV